MLFYGSIGGDSGRVLSWKARATFLPQWYVGQAYVGCGPEQHRLKASSLAVSIANQSSEVDEEDINMMSDGCNR